MTQIGTAGATPPLAGIRGSFGAALLPLYLALCLGGSGALAQGSPSLFDARRDGVLPPGAIRPPEDPEVTGAEVAEPERTGPEETGPAAPGLGPRPQAPVLSFGSAIQAAPGAPDPDAARPLTGQPATDIPSAAPADAYGVIADMPAAATQDRATGEETGPAVAVPGGEAQVPAGDRPASAPVRAPIKRPLPRPQPDPAAGGTLVAPDVAAPEAQAPAAPARTPRPAGCADPAQSRDADARRNAALIEGSGLCLRDAGVREHGRDWRVTRIAAPAVQGPTILLLDDSDDATFDLALRAAVTQGATLIAIETAEARTLAGQDPARNFGATPRATANCAAMSPAPSPLFARAIADLVPSGPILGFAAPDPDLSAGRTTDRQRGMLAPGGAGDPHSLVLTADLTAQAPDLPDLLAALSGQGLNTVHLRLDPPGDCTLLSHAVLTKLGRPLILHADPSGRAQMLEATLTALKSLK